MYLSEEAVKLGVYLVSDEREVLRTMLVVQVVGFYDQDLSIVLLYPLLISLIQIAQVLNAYAFLVLSATFLNL